MARIPLRTVAFSTASTATTGTRATTSPSILTVSSPSSAPRATGASGVMAARGWLRDPWLLRRIAGETELPDVETGRQRFFAEVLSGGFRCCRAIELSLFLWGRDNPWFDRLRRLPPGATVGPELFR